MAASPQTSQTTRPRISPVHASVAGGRCEYDGEGEAQQEELPPVREGYGHGCDKIGLVGGMKPSHAVDSLPRLLQMRSPLPVGASSDFRCRVWFTSETNRLFERRTQLFVLVIVSGSLS